MHIGKRLFLLRKRKGLSQEGISKGIISRGHYSNIESGRYKASDDIIELLAAELNVPFEYLYGTKDKQSNLAENLRVLYQFIQDREYDHARRVISNIRTNFPYIFSYEQELHFNILICYFLIQTKQHKTCTNVMEELNVYVDDPSQLTAELAFIYHYVMGLWYYCQSVFPLSYESFQYCLNECDNEIEKGNIYYNLALASYGCLQNYQAINFAKRSLQIQLTEHKWFEATKSYLLLGINYWEMSNIEDAKNNMKKALDLGNAHDYEELKGSIYHNLALIYQSENNYDYCIHFLEKSIEAKLNTNYESVIITYCNLIDLYLEIDQIDQAKGVLIGARNYVKKEEDSKNLDIYDAKILYLENQFCEYEELMNELIHYYTTLRSWRKVKDLTEEYSQYLGNNLKYKLAFNYSQLALKANQYLYEKGGLLND
ncbi:helix-turn-helix transcriptional regulator [Evansella halocellulosilytica]|uniref:helix-turn-helix transcriptional regulator n=1 Tax=Evansella halocellulosilytica TaxID=2011013 RepID=UPI000BB8FBDC|nr:helix-turn-helix transcriptional regulator [Evansella halocellulosilytica]